MPSQISFLLVALSLHTTTAVVYNVRSDDNISINSNGTDSAEILEYYLKNTSKYFSSYSTLHFKMGHHHLNTDLVIQNVTNVTLIGESFSIIGCTSHVSIIILNVTNFRLQGITFDNRSANYTDYLHTDFSYDSAPISKLGSNVSILLYHCTSVEISNITISFTEGNIGMLVVNVRNYAKITKVHIIVQIMCPMVKKVNCRLMVSCIIMTTGIIHTTYHLKFNWTIFIIPE